MRKKAIVNLLVNSKGPRYQINMSKPVKVYWNLHRKCFSVQQDGLVKAHLNRVYLHDVQFKVSESGRQRVIKEQRKNVHAFAIGIMDGNVESAIWDKDPVKVSYNPYKYSTFVTENEESINAAPLAKLENRQIVAWI